MLYESTADVDGVAPAGAVGVKTAVSECAPTVSVDVVNVALVPLTAAVPRAAVPSRNWTLPAAPAGVTDAVSVTGDPEVAVAAGLAVRVVVVAVAPLV